MVTRTVATAKSPNETAPTRSEAVAMDAAARRDFLAKATFSRGRRLLPHQIKQALFAIERRHTINSSETGCGKTLVALATRHLIEQGCCHIAHLRGPELGIADDRLAGYRQALKKNGITSPARYIVPARYLDTTGYSAMRKLLEATPRPDGVFCYNDPVAIGAIKAICEARLRVPDDIAVVGAGNVHYSDVLAVPLTTVDQNTETIGKQAAELLLEQINANQKTRVRRVLVTPKLVVRQSTQRTD